MKFRDILVSKEAIFDLNRGRDFFEAVEEGLGDYFYDCMILDVESLKFFGGIHYKEFGFYKMSSKKFSHFIYYDIKDDLIYILAILSMRKNPTNVQNAINKRQ